MSNLKQWPSIKLQVQNFVGVWIVSHLAFLHKYAEDKGESLAKAESEIFEIDYMKQFKLKYFLKRRFPLLHDQIVVLKLKLKN